MGDSGGRSVLEGAFRLLEAVHTSGDAGLTALASGSGLPKATAHRLLEQMVELQVVERSAGRYRMGRRMFRLGQSWLPYPGLLAAAREPVGELARATGATVGICALSEGRTLSVAAVSGEAADLVSPRPGVTWPWSTAAGKVLVAHAGPRLPIGPLPASWPREAAAIRDRGVALDHEELISGVCCAAVPVCGRSGQVVAALYVLTEPGRPLPLLADAAVRASRTVGRSLRGRTAGQIDPC